jgi:type IV pilus assembly protein PilP
MMRSALPQTLAVLAAALLLAGCGAAGKDELQQWMTDQRAQTKPKIDALPEPKKFVPQAYLEASAADPFSNQKLTQALRRDTGPSSASAALLAPELARRKEPLESFPLDTMVMVGTLMKQGKPVALVKVDNLLYQVRPGAYLGQNYGRILKVSESDVVLREIVQDAAGEWIERTATLQLQERAK